MRWRDAGRSLGEAKPRDRKRKVSDALANRMYYALIINHEFVKQDEARLSRDGNVTSKGLSARRAKIGRDSFARFIRDDRADRGCKFASGIPTAGRKGRPRELRRRGAHCATRLPKQRREIIEAGAKGTDVHRVDRRVVGGEERGEERRA